MRPSIDWVVNGQTQFQSDKFDVADRVGQEPEHRCGGGFSPVPAWNTARRDRAVSLVHLQRVVGVLGEWMPDKKETTVMEVLGIDIGGTGIKGAPVDVDTGKMMVDRYRLLTPQPAHPEAITDTVAKIVRHFDWTGPVGCGFPAVILHGVACTAANVSSRWIGTDARSIFESATGCTFTVGNDADVAGLAEMRFGAGKGRNGVVLIVTLGTGIGTALFVDGRLVPNTELGHIEIRGKDAEKRAAESIRDRKNLSWKKWAGRVDEYLHRMHAYLWPELIVIGGGISKKHAKFLPRLTVDTEVVPAQLRNEAGIIGGALAAAEQMK